MAEQNRGSESGLEIAKMHLDAFKHITTFCSGAILLTATVVAALFPEPVVIWLLALSITCFAIGVAFALLGLVFTFRVLERRVVTFRLLGVLGPRVLFPVNDFLFAFLVTSVLAAYLGVVAFSFFAAGNVSTLDNKEGPRGKEQSRALHNYPGG